MLSRFLNFIGSTGESLEEKCESLYEFASSIDNHKLLESELMRYITFQENRIIKIEISSGTLRTCIKAIKLFFTMNNIHVNWDKIKMRMPTFNQTYDDRIPEIEEINAMLDYNDIRIKPIVLTMLSSGIKVGHGSG
jgi:translation initiation factor 2B subunit (eIF-2B alpha/beta/delta family)